MGAFSTNMCNRSAPNFVFFPCTTRLWNELPPHLQESTSLSELKLFLRNSDSRAVCRQWVSRCQEKWFAYNTVLEHVPRDGGGIQRLNNLPQMFMWRIIHCIRQRCQAVLKANNPKLGTDIRAFKLTLRQLDCKFKPNQAICFVFGFFMF
jgi:hypothetical protein